MSETTNRAMNLDEEGTLPVIIGGRDFTLRQMSRPKIERILLAAAKDMTQPVPAAAPAEPVEAPAEPVEGETAPLPVPEQTDEEFMQSAAANWDGQLPTFAMILGYFDLNTDEALEVIAHLQEHLAVPAAFKLYRKWWEFNEIRDFFLRSGHPTLPPDLFDAIAAKASL